MAVRIARFTDIPAMAGVLEAAYPSSIYAGKATFDPRAARQNLTQCVQRHGHQTPGGTLALVSERDGEVCGLMIGLLDLIYPCLSELVATDFMFVLGDDAPASDAVRMVKAVIAWAEKNPRVIEVMLGANDTMGDEWTRVGALYQRCGLTQCGAMYQKRFER